MNNENEIDQKLTEEYNLSKKTILKIKQLTTVNTIDDFKNTIMVNMSDNELFGKLIKAEDAYHSILSDEYNLSQKTIRMLDCGEFTDEEAHNLFYALCLTKMVNYRIDELLETQPAFLKALRIESKQYEGILCKYIKQPTQTQKGA